MCAGNSYVCIISCNIIHVCSTHCTMEILHCTHLVIRTYCDYIKETLFWPLMYQKPGNVVSNHQIETFQLLIGFECLMLCFTNHCFMLLWISFHWRVNGNPSKMTPAPMIRFNHVQIRLFTYCTLYTVHMVCLNDQVTEDWYCSGL